MLRSFTLVLIAAALAACFGNGSSTPPAPDSYRGKRAAEIQKKINRQRCDFAVLVVQNNYQDPVILYTLRYSGEQTGTGMGGNIFPNNEEVICISPSRLTGNSQLLLRAQTSRGSVNSWNRVESELLPVQQGEVWQVTVMGNIRGLNNIAFLRNYDVSVWKKPDAGKTK